MSLRTIAAALQKEMKDSITVVAITTLGVIARVFSAGTQLLSASREALSNLSAELADGLELESTLSCDFAPGDPGSSAHDVSDAVARRRSD